MPARIFLHVGSPKTGTTFLQNVLWSQRERAQEQGLLLPLRGFHDHFHATLDVRELTGHGRYADIEPGKWGAMVEEAERWDGTVLISHELFAGATQEQADKALSLFAPDTEVHVIVTARDLMRQLPAEWQEHVKHRYRHAFEHFLAEIEADPDHDTWFWRVQDVADVLDRWGHLLPRDRVHLVTVPSAGAGPTVLWTRFAGLLGLDAAAFDLEQSRSNTSLGAEQTELLRRFNVALGDRLPMGSGYPAAVKEVLAHQVLSARQGTPLTVPAPYRDFVLRRSNEIAERLVVMAVDVVGSLDDLTPGPAEQPNLPAPDLGDAVIAEETMQALIGMTQQEKRAGERIRTLRAELGTATRGMEDWRGRALAAEAERDQLRHDMQHRPFRHLLVGLSERWKVVMAMRNGFHACRRAVIRGWRRLRGKPADDVQ